MLRIRPFQLAPMIKRCYATHNPFDESHLKSLEQSLRNNPELLDRLQNLARMIKEKKLIDPEDVTPYMSSMNQIKTMAKLMKDQEVRSELIALAPLLKGLKGSLMGAPAEEEKGGSFLASLFGKKK
jgi:hypothetical protein